MLEKEEMMKRFGMMFAVMSVLALTGRLDALPISASRHVISETVELAAKRSGRALTPAARHAMEEAAAKAFAKYGDDVLRTLEKGGLEAIRQGERHGDGFWKLCANASPRAARSLALHADALMPLAKRIGSDFVTLEGKVPGLAEECVRLFGDGSAKTLSRFPPGEIKQLIGYARRADSPQTAGLLYEACQKSGGQVLKHLNWKQIMAGGLSAGIVITAYRISGGVAELSQTHPGQFAGLVDKWTRPFHVFLWGIILVLLWYLYRFIRKSFHWMESKIPEPAEDKTKAHLGPDAEKTQNIGSGRKDA